MDIKQELQELTIGSEASVKAWNAFIFAERTD